jgi:hypothetical protein
VQKKNENKQTNKKQKKPKKQSEKNKKKTKRCNPLFWRYNNHSEAPQCQNLYVLSTINEKKVNQSKK